MAISIVATPVIDGLIKKLGSVVWAELGLVFGLKDDIQELNDKLSTISLVLQHAESGDPRHPPTLHKWLKDLKYAALDADDVLDELQTDAALSQQGGIKEEVRRFFSSHNSISFRYKMARKIRNIQKKFDKIAEDRIKFHLHEGAPSVQKGQLKRETFSCIDEEGTFGRDDDKKNVIEWLTAGDNVRDVSILPIVGLGGLGKTTLAKLVYNDNRVERYFEIRKWVCVGETFDVNAIMKAVLECKGEFSRLEDMQQQCREKLGSKRYLLILDDVWDDDIASKWEDLKLMLTNGTHGSKIIVTTRIQEVATVMGTVSDPYNLKSLSDDICWMIFEKRAFGRGKAQKSSDLVQIGKEIVKRCGGLPLAVKSLGSLMGTMQEERKWLAIKESEIWSIDGEILPALQLSYNHLSPHLKQCFTYCSLFPKDYTINKLRLIQLWMAQGFVHSEEDNNIEDIGNDYFNVLLHRSFFQDEYRDENDNIMSCKMHDLVHDLASYVAKDESSIVEIGKKKVVPDGCLYSSIIYHDQSSSTLSTISEVSYETKKLRSYFLLSPYTYANPIRFAGMDSLKFSKVVSDLTQLRALHLQCVLEKNNVSILGGLRRLRFLELSCPRLEYLPDSITDLINLQTLNIRECSELKELPKGIKKMCNLRHLDIGYKYNRTCLSGMPRGIGKLTNLQTLSVFHVGTKPNDAGIAELQYLNQIKGELCIRDLENVKNPKDTMEAKLSSKSGLQSLELTFKRSLWDEDEASASLAADLLENLQPHPNLKSLSIEGCMGHKLPNWLTNHMLPNLVHLKLDSVFAGCESLPPFGLLRSLRTLDLQNMNSLKKIGMELYWGEPTGSAFSNLKTMYLWLALNLEEWAMPEKDAFPSLETLEIRGCPKLRIQGRLPSSLVSLIIDSGHEELLAAGGCLHGLSRLRKLKIQTMKASTTGWKGLQYLTGLEELQIKGCAELIRLPEGLIQHHFSSLTTLLLDVNTKLESLRGGGELEEQQPPPLFMSLHRLEIRFCDRLSALPGWLQCLASLQSLTLYSCPNLKMLPDGIQNLAGLKQLTIARCTLLVRRCQRGTGEDWHKIAHIPNLSID